MRRRLEKSWFHIYICKDKEHKERKDKGIVRKREKLRKIRKIKCVIPARNPARIPR